MLHHGCAYAIVLLWLCSLSLTSLARNVTLDDQNGDPETGRLVVYQPEDLWTQGESCTQCTIQPDKSQVYDNTWHDSTFHTSNTEVFTLSMIFPSECVDLCSIEHCLT